MVIVKLKGGMGNQMFQYALGRRLSHDWNTPLKLDITGFQNQPPNDTKRHYSLDHFNIIEDFATEKEISRFRFRFGIFSRIRDFYKRKILKQHHVGYEGNILIKKKNVYLDGFWHNEKYFESIRNILLKEFTLKNPLSPAAGLAAKAISDAGDSSVSLHVRRGDFASDSATHKYHGLMTTEYYGGAIELLKGKVRNLKIFVFSDDIDWVKNNIPFKDEHFYVTNSAIPYHQEVELMSRCKHNIIANSSFSWWGAWLNQNPDKIVIAPEKWLAKTGTDFYKEIPESWIKI
jgi:hypothetical protein